MAKEKVLFILHLPPPVHGSSVVGKQIFDSKKINEKFNCVFINLSTSTQVDKIGEISMDKFITFFKILLKIFKTLLFRRIDKVYLAPTVSSGGFYKDYGIKIKKININMHTENFKTVFWVFNRVNFEVIPSYYISGVLPSNYLNSSKEIHYILIGQNTNAPHLKKITDTSVLKDNIHVLALTEFVVGSP